MMLVGALIVLLAGSGVARAQATDLGQLQWDAERRYQEGALDEALELANEAIQRDGSSTTASARRLVVEIALRQGDFWKTREALAAYGPDKSWSATERAWASRAQLRLDFEVAERDGELALAAARLSALRAARLDLRPAEVSWLSWAEWRLDVRATEQLGNSAVALALLDGRELPPNSPEGQWILFTRARIQTQSAEYACEWGRARVAVAALEDLRLPIEGAARWGGLTKLRLDLRSAVQEARLEDAWNKLGAMEHRDLTTSEQSWVEGYAAWLGSEIARLEGNVHATDLSGQIEQWREAFPGETGCEASELRQVAMLAQDQGASEAGSRRSSTSAPRQAEPALELDASRSSRPTHSTRDLRPAVPASEPQEAPRSTRGVNVGEPEAIPARTAGIALQPGVSIWTDDATTPASGNESQHTISNAAMGLSANLGWSPISLGSAGRLGAAASLMTITMIDLYSAADLRVSLIWQGQSGGILANFGARTASRMYDEALCAKEPPCLRLGEGDRVVVPNGYVGASAFVSPISPVEIWLTAGWGPGDIVWFDRVQFADVSFRWRPSSASPTVLGVSAGGTWASKAGPKFKPTYEVSDRWLVATVGLRFDRAPRAR